MVFMIGRGPLVVVLVRRRRDQPPAVPDPAGPVGGLSARRLERGRVVRVEPGCWRRIRSRRR